MQLKFNILCYISSCFVSLINTSDQLPRNHDTNGIEFRIMRFTVFKADKLTFNECIELL